MQPQTMPARIREIWSVPVMRTILVSNFFALGVIIFTGMGLKEVLLSFGFQLAIFIPFHLLRILLVPQISTGATLSAFGRSSEKIIVFLFACMLSLISLLIIYGVLLGFTVSNVFETLQSNQGGILITTGIFLFVQAFVLIRDFKKGAVAYDSSSQGFWSIRTLLLRTYPIFLAPVFAQLMMEKFPQPFQENSMANSLLLSLTLFIFFYQKTKAELLEASWRDNAVKQTVS